MSRVLIFADSTNAFVRLTAIIRSAPALELIVASGDRDVLTDQIERLEAEDRVVLIESVSAADAYDFLAHDFGLESVVRLVLTERKEYAAAVAAMKEPDSEIRGILPAWIGAKEILAAVEGVGAGLIVFHPDVLDELKYEASDRGQFLPEHSSGDAPYSQPEQLSPRESEVLNLLADGLANKEIAWRLKISEHTVKFHVTSIFNKLSVSTRAEAVAVGARRGLIIL